MFEAILLTEIDPYIEWTGRMNEIVPPTSSASDGLHPEVKALIGDARSSSLRAEVDRSAPDGSARLKLHFPSGRKHHLVVVSEPDHATDLRSYPYDRWTVIDQYAAVLDMDQKEIVAGISLRGARFRNALERIPGIKVIIEEFQDLDDTEAPYIEKKYLLELEDSASGIIVTISTRDHAHQLDLLKLIRTAFVSPYSVLRIKGVNATRHDEAKELLSRLSSSLFFDLDVTYGLTLNLTPRFDRPVFQGSANRSNQDPIPLPTFPRNSYPEEAVNLYLHAQNYLQGYNLPLPTFLSYYQVIEYFLPSHARRDTIEKLKQELKHPKMNVHDDVSIGRLIDLAAGAAVRNEREQLPIVVEHCCTTEQLRRFISSNKNRLDFLTKKCPITGTVPLRLDSEDLCKQVARRIYVIRCRIVHAKDGYDAHGPLLPYSEEARQLRHDTDLAKYVAQQILIAASSPMKV